MGFKRTFEMLAAGTASRQARSHDRRRVARTGAALDGLALLPRRHGSQLPGAAHPRKARARAIAWRGGIADGVLQPAGARQVRRRDALAVGVDTAAARPGPLAGAAPPAQQIESAARMAHKAAPTQKLQGSEWHAVGALLPYVLEYKWRVALALVCLIVAKLANVGVPLVMKSVVDRLDAQTALLAVPVALLAI